MATIPVIIASLDASATRADTASRQMYDVANGPAMGPSSSVASDSGPIPTILKFLADNQAAIDAGEAGMLQARLIDPAQGPRLVAYQLAGVAGAVSRLLQDKLEDARWIEDLIQPGDIGIHAALARACAAGGSWQIGAGPYSLGAGETVVIPSGFKIRFNGTTINHPATAVPTFWAHEAEDWAMLGSLLIVGSGKTNGTAVGVQRVAGRRFYVENVECREISGRGFYEINGTYIPGTRGDRGNWINCRAVNCWIGRDDIADSSVEYNLWLNFTATGCTYGNITSAGNNQFVGGNIVDNDVGGVWLKNGGNHAHGMFVGVNINHNGPGSGGWNIRATDVTNGESFTGCHVYADNPGTGILWLERSHGILFTGGVFDASIFCDTLTGYNVISGNHCPDSVNTAGKYGPTGPNDPSVSKAIVLRNSAPTGMWRYNDPGTCFLRATQSIPQAIPSNVTTTLFFNTESYDTRAIHDTSTGVSVLPWLGNFKVYGCVRVTGSAIPATGGFLTLLINGVATAFAPVTAHSANLALGSFAWVAGAAGGATVEVQLTLVGAGLVLDSGSQLVIEEVT